MTGDGGSLSLYLRGHHAGGGAAVRTVRQQAAIEPDGPDNEVGRLLARLATEIDEDLATLRDVMARLGVRPSVVHETAARVGAGGGRWVLRAHSPGTDQARLIGLESLSLGIEGKVRLWRTLQAIAPDEPRLDGVDLAALVERAERQRDDLEPHRLAAARRTLHLAGAQVG